MGQHNLQVQETVEMIYEKGRSHIPMNFWNQSHERSAFDTLVLILYPLRKGHKVHMLHSFSPIISLIRPNEVSMLAYFL